MKADFIIRQGEPLTLSLLAIDGDISNIASVDAVLKAAGTNGSVPPSTAPVIATFTVSDANAPDLGWNLVIDGDDTVDIKPGFYITNAKLNLTSGGPVKTDHVLIEVRGSVT